MLAEVKASAAETGGQYSLVEITAPPGLQTPLHVHYRDDEGFYVLEGGHDRGRRRDRRAGAGRHAFGPRNIPHRLAGAPTAPT